MDSALQITYFDAQECVQPKINTFGTRNPDWQYTYFMNLKRLMVISRPRFWMYEIGPYIIGIAAATQSDYNIWLTAPVIVFFLFFLYPANIYIYGINDAFDYETDRLNPKKVAYESLVMPEERETLFLHILFVITPFLLYVIAHTNLITTFAFIAFLFFAGFYSATPIRAKARPVLDSIFSAGHYVATGVFSYLFVCELLGNTASLASVGLSILAGMFWATAMHAYSAVPDIQADMDAGLQTIATVLKKRKTLLLCAFLYLGAGMLAIPLLGPLSLVLAFVYTNMMFASLHTKPTSLFRLYTLFPWINTIAGMLIFFKAL